MYDCTLYLAAAVPLEGSSRMVVPIYIVCMYYLGFSSAVKRCCWGAKLHNVMFLRTFRLCTFLRLHHCPYSKCVGIITAWITVLYYVWYLEYSC